MIFWDLFERYSQFYAIVSHFEANKCIIRVKNMQNCVAGFSPGQTVVHIYGL